MKTIHPAVAQHAMEENERLRGLLREIAEGCTRRDMPSEQTVTKWADRIDAALSQQADPECRCTMRQRLAGDGCSVCNPEYAADHEDDPVEPATAQGEREAAMESIIRAQRKSLGICASQIAALQTTPIAQTAQRCQCCGYLVTDSEHRGCLRAATPVPEQSGLVDALTQLLRWAEKQFCTHEETHRGGAIWEICDSCGAKWADDEGGRPAFEWPKAISNASAALSAKGDKP